MKLGPIKPTEGIIETWDWLKELTPKVREKIVNFNEYQVKAAETAMYKGKGTNIGLVYVALGLTGEAGEVANKVKKILRGDHGFELTPQIREALIDEAGDTCWYLSQLCEELNIGMAEVAQRNLKKLESRLQRGVIKGSGDNR